MTNLECKICPENHYVPYATWNVARDFSDGGVDAMTLEPQYESGLYCHQCNKAYGLSKLRDKIENEE